jgi:hypothetical protein
VDEVRYQVFVSSTFSDLKEEREKVLQAILQLRAFPSGMELFPAADDEQFEFIKREIDSSDYYVVIIGGKYGSVDESGISFTEKEYEYAQSVGKPVLAFIVRDVGKLIGDKLEKKEQLRLKLQAFTERAKKSKLVNFYSNPDELKASVLVSLPSQFNLRPMQGWVRAGLSRREDLERISSLQQRVLDLDAENQRLKLIQEDATKVLASGQEPVRWTIQLRGIKLPDETPPSGSFSFETSWDSLMTNLFTFGRSDLLESEARKVFCLMLVRNIPENLLGDTTLSKLRKAAEDDSLSKTWASAELVLREIKRQFCGLGLMQESAETRYIHDIFIGKSAPQTVRVWNLTQRGNLQLALLKGKRKPTS